MFRRWKATHDQLASDLRCRWLAKSIIERYAKLGKYPSLRIKELLWPHIPHLYHYYTERRKWYVRRAH